MYAFVDHHSHDYITDNTPVDRTPKPDETITHRGASGAPRPVLPSGWANESLMSFSRDELSEGWEVAQTAQIIGAVFAEMFTVSEPCYFKIARAAHAWQRQLTDAWHGDPERAEEFKAARQLLQGVIDAARAGINGRPTRWTPWRRGLNLDVTGPQKAPEADEVGGWYDAKGVDGSDWQVRKYGKGVVEAVNMADGTSITLTRKQARNSLTIKGKAA